MTHRSTALRGALVCSLAGTLALSACGSGSDEAAQSSSAAPSSPEGTVVTAETSSPPEETYVPLTSLDPKESRAAFGNVYKQLLTGRTAAGKPGTDARAAAFSGQQLKVAEAEAKTGAVTEGYAKPDAEAAKTPPVMLVVTTKESPHRMVLGEGQPVKANLPELYLLESAAEPSGLKITHAARMLPARRLQKLQAPANGTPEVPETTPIAKTTPQAFLQQYSAFVTYPLPAGDGAAQPFKIDPYITGVRTAAQTRAEDLGEHGTYTMKNTVVPGSTRVLKRQDGALIVFTHLLRTESVTVKDSASITAPKAVTAINPALKTITKNATMQTDVCLVFYMFPAAKTELVAASEQLVGATGS